MTYDAGLVARIADLLPAAEIRTARQKNVFGGRGFLLGKSTFVIAWRDGLLVKTPPAEYEASLALPGVTAFAPDGEHAMGTWLLVPPRPHRRRPRAPRMAGPRRPGDSVRS